MSYCGSPLYKQLTRDILSKMTVLSSQQMLGTEKKNLVQGDIGIPPPKYREIDSAEAVKLLNESKGAFDEAKLKDLTKSSCSSSRSTISQPPDYSLDIPDDETTDPWKECGLQEQECKAWTDLTVKEKCLRVTGWVLKPVLLIGLLYVFVCSLSLLSSSFRLVGGKAAGKSFSSNGFIQNPVCGLMIGIVSTVLVQSSSTSTSIVVTMVASGILDVRAGIPIIMGANIGTSVTSTLVSMMQSSERAEFRRAFGGATVHDMFNWLSVIVLLPLEVMSGYLYHITSAIINSLNLNGNSMENQDLLKTITKPLLNKIIQLDKEVILKIAMGDTEYSSHSMVKRWCQFDYVEVNATRLVNKTFVQQKAEELLSGVVLTFKENVTRIDNETYLTTEKINKARCDFVFANVDLSDTTLGLILLAISLFFMCTCLVLMVKLLSSILRGSICRTLKKLFNRDSKNCLLRHLTGYFAILLGAGMTILVQSSSVFTSVLTPLVGLGVIEIERMYPLTLGSNLGTTTTCLLAALAASSDKLGVALQIALCHFFFNISGIILFYPVPVMRLPIKLAKIMGNTTARYRWFALMYLICMFVLLPGAVFALSMCGIIAMFAVLGPIMLIIIAVITINILQNNKPAFLPNVLRNWEFLPECLHSLDPIDRLFIKMISAFKNICNCKSKEESQVTALNECEMQPMKGLPESAV